MPYKTSSGGAERARGLGHVPITESGPVREALRRYRVHQPGAGLKIDPGLLVPADALGPPGPPVRWLLAIDGSQAEVAVRAAYPSTRLGYAQTAGVFLHLDRLLSEGANALVDPAAVGGAAAREIRTRVLPGSNVCRPDMPTVRDSWRAELYEVFRNYRVEDTLLLEVFRLLVARHPEKRSATGGVLLARCAASGGCRARDIDVPFGGRPCPDCAQRLFPTDALRLHEGVAEEHGNAAPLGPVLAVLQHLTLAGYLLFLSRRLGALAGVTLVMDGPLALFGGPAWLHAPLRDLIQDLQDRLRARGLRGPLTVGVEKTGHFVEYADAVREQIPRRCLMLLPDDYIYRHVVPFRPAGEYPFGHNTYYGQKFFYRTAKGELLTITVPGGASAGKDRHLPYHYPGLPAMLALLDRIGTRLYRNALIPVVLAHSAASIPAGESVPVRLGQKDFSGPAWPRGTVANVPSAWHRAAPCIKRF